MRKKLLIFIIVFFLVLIFTLNKKVTTKQGRDYVVTELKIPLSLKLQNFFNRHFNYQWLVDRITSHLETGEEKVFRLFQWTHETIRPQPESLPIMDDHVWNVYIRGYGVSDNFHDLFSTLCNYAGVDGFFKRLTLKDSRRYINITFVRVGRGWVAFDPYNGAYFKNRNGNWATIEEIKQGNWELVKLSQSDINESYYRPFLGLIPEIKTLGYKRANTQSPFNRFMLQFNRVVSGKRALLE